MAERKVGGLLTCGATVKVVGPEVTAGLEDLAAQGRISLIRRGYRRGDLAGAFLAFATTGDARANSRARNEARGRGVLFNAADDPRNCDFIVPAVLQRGALTVAVATAARSPALARHIRDRLAAGIGPEYASWVEILAATRSAVRERLSPVQRRELFSRLAADERYPNLLAAGREQEVLDAVEREVAELIRGDGGGRAR